MPKVNKPKSTDIQEQLAQKLQTLRKQKGISQSEVANYIGLTVGAYQNYENGRREANYKTLTKFAELFNVSIDYLLGREPKIPEYLTESEKELEEQMMEKYRKLPEQFRKKFLQGVMEVAALQKQKIEIQQNTGAVPSSMEHVGTIGEELERREQEARAEAEAIRKDTA